MRQPSAICGGHAVAACGELASEDHAQFLADLHSLIGAQLAAKQKGSKGHQTNPAFIHAMVLQTMAAWQARGGGGGGVSPSQHGRGGFTDVGRHTGSQPRDTAWPLVREVTQVSHMMSHDGGRRLPRWDQWAGQRLRTSL